MVREFGWVKFLGVWALLLVAVAAAYSPAWNGGMLWDDEFHVTSKALAGWDGLYRIWFEVGASLQYYPLLHSAFWVEHRIWGDNTTWYHLLNIILHATAAAMIWAALKKLKIPGAGLAAGVWALAPVQAESVAWIAEQKNTLSAVFYLGALLAYLEFDENRKGKWYAAALGLFVAAIMTKTVTATLPGAILVILWWKRGKLSWRKDVAPVLPMFAAGACAGIVTAWWELRINECTGPEFQNSLAQRIIIAGRTAWHSAGKLLWPTHLSFIYPRWDVDAGKWWQWLFPLGALAAVAGAWAARKWSRAPLAAVLFFGGTLFPVMGFFNLYTFRYSFVADHYQYLACAGLIALGAGGLAWVLSGAHGPASSKDYAGAAPGGAGRLWHTDGGGLASAGVCAIVLIVLGTMTWMQAREYTDAATLYRATIEENTTCWMPYNNLGHILADRGETKEAIKQYEEALRADPECREAHNNLGSALNAQGRTKEAIVQFREALRIKPDYGEAHNNLGNALAKLGDWEGAIREYGEALKAMPKTPGAHLNLGVALQNTGRRAEAMEEYRKAIGLAPRLKEAHNNLGAALEEEGKLKEAIVEYEEALRIDRNYEQAKVSLEAAREKMKAKNGAN